MAKFRIYNVQLLPQAEGIDEVGASGYRRLFAAFRDLNRQYLSSKTQKQFHFALGGDSYMAPNDDFRFPAGYVSGNFVRYTTTEKLTELQSGKTLFRAQGKTAVASQRLFPFVFDTKRHFLAIDGTSLPKGSLFVSALEQFLRPVAEKYFANHTLTINLISRANALEDVFRTATAYRTVDVVLSFPNGHETERLLRELKETKTQLNVHASGGGTQGRMSGVPEFLKDMLRAAVTFGSAKMNYFVPPSSGKKIGHWETYNSEDTPVTFTVRHSPNDADDNAYFGRVAEKLSAIDLQDEDDDDDNQTAQ